MEIKDRENKETNKKVSLLQVIIQDFIEGNYLKGILEICSGLGVVVFFSLFIHGAVTIVIANNFSVNYILLELFSLVFCLIVFYLLVSN